MPYEATFLTVGDSYGDAIVIRYGRDDPGYLLHVVDGGRLDTAQTIIGHIDQYYRGYHTNQMVLSHPDNDHACGLIEVLRRYDVKHLWMNRLVFTSKKYCTTFTAITSLRDLLRRCATAIHT